MVTPSSERHGPGRFGAEIQSVYPWLDQLLQPLLQVGTGLDTAPGRCLLNPLGAQQIQAPTPATEGCTRVVLAGCPRPAQSVCPLGISACQRPDIRSRVRRESHARI